jgi:hypothetical protein
MGFFGAVALIAAAPALRVAARSTDGASSDVSRTDQQH